MEYNKSIIKLQIYYYDINFIIICIQSCCWCSRGFNPIYGARPLRRAIMNLLEDNLAGEFLEKEMEPGTNIVVNLDESQKVSISVTGITLDEEEEDEAVVKPRRRTALSSLKARKA